MEKGVDRTVVVVVSAIVVYGVARAVVPALIAGERVGMAVVTLHLLLILLAFAFIPTWGSPAAKDASEVVRAAREHREE